MCRSSDLFAHISSGTVGYEHLFPIPEAVRMCGLGEVVAIRVVEDPEGPLHGWWSPKNGYHTMIYPSIQLLDMCFPQGVREAQKQGLGEAIRLRVEPR